MLYTAHTVDTYVYYRHLHVLNKAEQKIRIICENGKKWIEYIARYKYKLQIIDITD